MPPATRVIGLGQPAGGDDAVGVTVARALHQLELPPEVEVREICDTSRLIELVQGVLRVIIVDAVLSAGAAGRVRWLTEAELAQLRLGPLSSHAFDLGRTLALARVLAPAEVAPDIRVLGITIGEIARFSYGLSAPVAASVPTASAMLQACLER